MIKLNEVNKKECELKFGKKFLGTEKHTEFEKKLSIAIRNWFKENTRRADKNEYEELFSKLYPYKECFPNILMPETNKLYRASMTYWKQYWGELNFIKINDERKQKIYISKEKIKYYPKSKIQSWSPTMRVPLNLSTLGDEPKYFIQKWGNSIKTQMYFPCLYYAIINKNELLFNSETMKKLNKNFGEEEILRLGWTLNVNLIVNESTIQLLRKRGVSWWNYND